MAGFEEIGGPLSPLGFEDGALEPMHIVPEKLLEGEFPEKLPEGESPLSQEHSQGSAWDMNGGGSESESPHSAFDIRRYDPEADTGYDLPKGAFEELLEYQRTEAVGGYFSPAAYDPEADVGYDLPEGPETEALNAAFDARQKGFLTQSEGVGRYRRVKEKNPKWAIKPLVKQGLLEVVTQTTESPYTAVGRVGVDDKHGHAFLGSCFLPSFSDQRGNELVGPGRLVSSAHLFSPLQDVMAAHVRFKGATGANLDFWVKKVSIPKKFTQAQDPWARRACDYAILEVAPYNGPDVSEVVAALPTTLGRTLLLPTDVLTRIGYAQNGGDAKLWQDTGHCFVEFANGGGLAAEGRGKRGNSGGPTMKGDTVVGVNVARSVSRDYGIAARMSLTELQDMFEQLLEWQGLGHG